MTVCLQLLPSKKKKQDPLVVAPPPEKRLVGQKMKDTKQSLPGKKGTASRKRGEAAPAWTYTLRGGDVNVAADEGQTVIHAHLEINHPESKNKEKTSSQNRLKALRSDREGLRKERSCRCFRTELCQEDSFNK